MARFFVAALATAAAFGLGGAARVEGGKDAKAVLDKAIKALGGEEKLAAVKAATWKSKGSISIAGNEGDFTTQATGEGLDRSRQEVEADIGGMKVTILTVLNGDKAWRAFNGMAMELDKDNVANTKRSVYLQMVPTLLLPLKGKDFKVESAGEDKVDGKPAAVLKVTGPDGKDFKLYFDKDSGLPVKEVAKVVGPMGDEFTMETTYGAYKEMGGIQKA